MARWMPLWVALSALGCKGEIAVKQDLAAEVPEDATSVLRLDVLPPTDLTDANGRPVGDLAQSFTPFNPEQSRNVGLRTQVTITGTLEGFVVAPYYAAAQLPGTVEPLPGLIHIERPGTLQVYNARADEAGSFNLNIIRGQDYVITYVPDDPTVPFARLDKDLPQGDDLSYEIQSGVAVYGQVVDDQGVGLPDMRVQVVDTQRDIRSASAYTNDDGHYVLWVEAVRRYRVEVLGGERGEEPVLASESALVADEGMNWDFTYNDLTRHRVGGRVVDAEDNPLGDVRVQFIADPGQLDAYGDEASMQIETDTDSSGLFSVGLLAGTWTMHVIPGPELPDVSPRTQKLTITDDHDEPDIELQPLVEVSGRVLDPFDALVKNAQVHCEEIAYGGRYYAIFAEDGNFTTQLPRTPMTCTLAPANGRSDIALTRQSIDPNLRDIDLLYEQGRRTGGIVRFEGEPVEFALVEIRDNKDQVWGSSVTDAEGRWKLRIAGGVSR